jgi:hypothetical protein
VCDAEKSLLNAVVDGESIYWSGHSGIGGVFELHSVLREGPVEIDDHELGLLWSPGKPIAWHIRDGELWTLTCFALQSPVESYYVAKAQLPIPKSNIFRFSEHNISDCEPLVRLRFVEKPAPLHFDFVPTAKDAGKLFVLGADRVVTIWDASFPFLAAVTREGDPLNRRHKGKWTKVAEYPAEFFEPFTIFMQPNGPAAVTESGRLYTLRGKREWARLRKFPPHGQGGIVAVIEDLRTGKTHAFTKTTCFTLSNPDVARPFKFPDMDDHPDSTAKALVQAVEFLDQK